MGRALMSQQLTAAARVLAGPAMLDRSAPALVRFLASVGQRSGVWSASTDPETVEMAYAALGAVEGSRPS